MEGAAETFAGPSRRFPESGGFGMPPDLAGGRPGLVVRHTAPLRIALNRVRKSGRLQRAGSGASGLSDIVFDPTDMDAMIQQLEELRTRHRDLDVSIEQLKADGGDDIRIMGLKREKLRIKDRIVWLSAKITPDIIA
jgi:hypothetical protein